MDMFKFISAIEKDSENSKTVPSQSNEIDEREKRLLELNSEIMLKDIIDEWSELLEEQEDLSIITEIIVDENYLWMSVKPENEFLVYRLLLELVQDNKSSVGKPEALKYLKNKLELWANKYISS